MVKFQFYLSDEDYDPLYAIKQDWGRNELTGNDFAALLLRSHLHRIHPQRGEEE